MISNLFLWSYDTFYQQIVIFTEMIKLLPEAYQECNLIWTLDSFCFIWHDIDLADTQKVLGCHFFDL